MTAGASASEFQTRLKEYEDVLDDVIAPVITPINWPSEFEDLVRAVRTEDVSQ